MKKGNNVILGMEEGERGNIELSYQYTLKKLNLLKKENIVMMDIGTNMGTLPYLMHNSGYNMKGIDVRSESIEKGKKKYMKIADRLFVVGNNLAEIPDKSIDIITMFDVIEHIPNIKEYMQDDIYRILKGEGILIFQTPNKRINPIFEIIKSKSLTKYKEYHCSLQTPKSLKKLLFQTGFKKVVIEKYTIESEYNRRKLKKYFGVFGIVLLKLFDVAPLVIYPNLWGYAQK